jgi:hypothetical protein
MKVKEIKFRSRMGRLDDLLPYIDLDMNIKLLCAPAYSAKQEKGWEFNSQCVFNLDIRWR